MKTEIVKLAIKSRITSIIVLLAGLASIGFGMIRHEHLDVLQKATKI